MKKYEWMRNDTISIMFASVESKKQSRLFRISAIFKDEEVNPERLKEAVRIAVQRFPLYTYRNTNGFFWSYLEKSDSLPQVLPEEHRPAELRRLGNDGTPEIVFIYYKRRLSIETSHVLGDGGGILELLKTVVAHYMILGGADKTDFTGIRFGDEEPSKTELEDPFERYMNNEACSVPERDKAYTIPYKYDENYQNHISGLVSVNDIKPFCKDKNITVSEFLAAGVILAMLRTAEKPIDKTIIIDVPVNLRNHFPSDTIRNFTSSIPLQFNPQGKMDYTFDEIARIIKGKLAQVNTKETQQAFINKNYALTQKKILQVIPYFIKKPVLNLMQKKSHTEEMTLIMSNIGNVVLPEVMSNKIERLELVSGDSRVYNMPMFFYIISMNGYMNIVFGLSGKDRRLCTEFFRILSSMGIPVRIESSLENGVEDNSEVAPKICDRCNVRIGEEYSRCPLCDSAAVITDVPDEYFKTALFAQPYKKYVHARSRKKSDIISVERLKAYFLTNP
ncbi:MAG: hypothetical protein J6Q94_08585 [Clostridia bacterium]|nr:hypothetical protein [Clostridia bacterium]